MSSSETSSRKRDAGTIHVAGTPNAKRTKRLRVSLACAECRKKKERCDGNQPVCGSCKSQSRDCSYVPGPKKRGLTTGYVRGLEILLGLIFHSVEGCEHSVVAILKGESAIASPGGREEETASTVNVLVDAWRNSPSWKELERILSTVESGEDEDLTARDLHDRLDEALKKSLYIKEETATSPIFSAASPPESLSVLVDDGSTTEAVGSHPQEDGGIMTKQTGAIQNLSSDTRGLSHLLQDWSELLDIYFAHTNCWIPIVLKNDAFRAAYTISAESNSENVNHLLLGDQSCLFSTLAYARYTQYITNEKNGCRQDLQNQFANLFAQASHLISTYESRRDVGDVQAMLVLTLLHYAQGNLGLAWSFVGRAVYHAVELGLLKSGNTLSPPLDDRSRRVVLSCFVLETLLSARQNRRPYMGTSDVESVGLLDADGIEEWEPWRPMGLSSSAVARNPPRPSHQPAKILSTFNLLVQTSTIINDNLQNHSIVTNKNAAREHLNILHPLQSENHLHSLVAQAEAHDASPQAVNLMLATAACLPHLVSTSADASYEILSCSNTITPNAHQILASVAEGVKKPGVVALSPISDVYLHIIESRNRQATSPLSHGALDCIKSVREIRARYNETWRNADLDPCDSAQATIHNQTEPTAVSNARSRVLGGGPNTQPSSRIQSSGTRVMDTAANGLGVHSTRPLSALVPLQQQGLTCSCRAPPDDARHASDSWSTLPTTLDMTGPSDLFSSLVSLDNDDSRHTLSQEFVENLGILGGISMDSVEFQNLFTA